MVGSSSVFGDAPVAEMAHSVASYQKLLHTLDGFTDPDAASPSLVPGWTRAHVLVHLSRHADSHVRMLEGLQKGERTPQYAGGKEGRRKAIDRATELTVRQVIEDLKASCETLYATWEAFPTELWTETVDTLGTPSKARDTVWSRWFEQEVHHVDLGLRYGPDSWPNAFVSAGLPAVVAGLPTRSTGEAPVGRWRLIATDRSQAWDVVVGPDAAAPPTVTEADPATNPDGSASGRASRLLLWLMGRPVEADDLDVDQVIEKLPRWAPYP